MGLGVLARSVRQVGSTADTGDLVGGRAAISRQARPRRVPGKGQPGGRQPGFWTRTPWRDQSAALSSDQAQNVSALSALGVGQACAPVRGRVSGNRSAA